MGTIPAPLVRSLKRRLGLVSAVETGTWVGGGALLLSEAFDEVTTIELSPEVAKRAREILAREPVTVLEGDSRRLLQPSIEPTFYFLARTGAAASRAGWTRSARFSRSWTPSPAGAKTT